MEFLMKATLIQSTKIADTNRGERAMLAFLRDLPEDCTVYRELKISIWDKAAKAQNLTKRPDFVVVSPTLGVLSIECKDWNLTENVYVWQDQYKMIVRRPNGQSDEQVDNPFHQAEQYKFALIGLLKNTGAWIDSWVAFPRLSRQQFLNNVENAHLLMQPQSRFLIDFGHALFKEDLDLYSQRPAVCFAEKLKAVRRAPVSPAIIKGINEMLIPSGFLVGGFTKRQQAKQELRLLSDKQMRWIEDVSDKANYLLDVAGSGKTNALTSKAMLMVDHAHPATPLKVLLTTYSKTLADNIQRIFESKLLRSNASDTDRYLAAIHIEGFRELLEAIWRRHEGEKSFAAYHRAGESDAEYEQRLCDDVEVLLELEPIQHQQFDAIFIDEIQDFSNQFLGIARRLCRTERFFFVGDIGQKIYERRIHNLAQFSGRVERVSLPRHYQMYRTPRYIGELANRFIMADAVIRTEFQENGYEQEAICKNALENAAELLRTDAPETLIVERLQSLLRAAYCEDDVMIITDITRLSAIEQALDAAAIQHARTQRNGCVTVVDFMASKGLEREIVFVAHIEQLYERRHTVGIFDSADVQVERERYSRRKVYVALTRTLEQLIIYYSDPHNRFISELQTFNTDIEHRRQQSFGTRG